MQEINKNKTIIEKMIKYCNKIIEIKNKNFLTKEKYLLDEVIQLALDMCIFQLREPLISRLLQNLFCEKANY